MSIFLFKNALTTTRFFDIFEKIYANTNRDFGGGEGEANGGERTKAARGDRRETDD